MFRAFVQKECPLCRSAWRIRTELGDYRLHEPVGRSGFSLVFRGEHRRTGEIVALKLIRLPAACEVADLRRFQTISRRLLQFTHPHCARVYAVNVESGFAWQATEWLPAGSLADRIAHEGRLSENATLMFLRQAALGLAAAQAAGMGDFDLKASNLRFAPDGTLKLTDLASTVFYERVADDLYTYPGQLYNQPPDRLRSGPAKERTMIYALAAVFFPALTGHLLHNGEVDIEAFFDSIDGPPVRVRKLRSEISAPVAALFERMLALAPEERFQTWTSLLAAIPTPPLKTSL